MPSNPRNRSRFHLTASRQIYTEKYPYEATRPYSCHCTTIARSYTGQNETLFCRIIIGVVFPMCCCNTYPTKVPILRGLSIVIIFCIIFAVLHVLFELVELFSFYLISLESECKAGTSLYVPLLQTRLWQYLIFRPLFFHVCL